MSEVHNDGLIEEHLEMLYNRLRRLQNHSRSNMPALIAQRATSTFTLHDEPLSEEAHNNILVIVYPQDPFVGEPEVRTMNANDIAAGLTNSRIRVVDDKAALAQPDSDGNYMYWPGTPQFDQVNCFYFATFTLRMYERYARRALSWSFPSPRISIVPNIGSNATAFYSEQDRMLGFHSFVLNNESFSTTWSADIISHETAHAILDGLRDLYNESFGLGPTAFHESFGDISAVLVAMHDDSLVRRLLDWTKGDLKHDNFVTRVAEQITDALQNGQIGYLRGHTVYLRNAINPLMSEPFDSLTYDPIDPEFNLGRQSHNYSRLFTGAFYDILVGIFEQLKKEMPGHIAIYRARDIAAYLLVTAVELGPVGEFDFSDIANAFLTADYVLYQGRYSSVIQEAFVARKILTQAQAQVCLNKLQNLPEILLPKSINSAMSSALFLEKDVLPKLNLPINEELTPLSAYRNAGGYAYLTYFSSQQIVLEGKEYGEFEGARIDLFGGLTLMFDSGSRLRSVFFRPVNETDIHQIKIMVDDLIELGLIRAEEDIVTDSRQNVFPHGVAIELPGNDNQQKSQIIKFPASVDPMPSVVSDFVDYLMQMKMKSSLDKE